jgi:hypothetical protein
MVGCDETYPSGDCYDGTVARGCQNVGMLMISKDCHLHEQDPIQHVG